MEHLQSLEVLAKAKLSMDQIKTKMDIGCSGIEIQLLNELKGTHGWLTLEEAFDLESFSTVPVSAVHAPIISGMGDLTIEQLADEDSIVFYETCRLAEFFGEKQNKTITVVVHSETYLEYIEGIGSTLSNIESMVQTALERYHHIRIGIENVSPLRGVGKGGDLHLANNFKFDNVKLANRLRFDLGTDRVGTVLDTCHALLAEKYIEVLYNAIGDRPHEDLSIDAFFNANKDTCFLIHLCGYQGSGYGKGRHGTPFLPNEPYDVEMVKYVLGLYSKLGYTCPITLEVEETDFAVCDGYANTLQTVRNVLYDGGLK